ncbi:hypothetical protein WA158_004145 [Blastocystis sp. Blastoise]
MQKPTNTNQPNTDQIKNEQDNKTHGLSQVDELASLEKLEREVMSILYFTKDIADEFSKPGEITPERLERSKQLTKDYYTTVNDVCDKLLEKVPLIVPYHQIDYTNYGKIEDKSIYESIQKLEDPCSALKLDRQ